MKLGMCVTSVISFCQLDGVKVLIFRMDELFVIKLLLILCDLKKSVICTCVFGLCSISIDGKQRFLAADLRGPVPIVV